MTYLPPATDPGLRIAGRPAPNAANVLNVASRHSVLARKFNTSASVKGPPGAPVLAARPAGGWAKGSEGDGAGRQLVCEHATCMVLCLVEHGALVVLVQFVAAL